MSLSTTSFFISVITSNILIILINIIFVIAGKVLYINPKYILLSIFFIIIKCFLPYEFFYSLTVSSETILPTIQKLGDYKILAKKFSVYQVLLFIWIIGTLTKFIMLIYKQNRLERSIEKLPNSHFLTMLTEIKNNKQIDKVIGVVEVPWINFSAIIGLRKPIIVIPNNVSLIDAKYIFLHELEHLRRNDLYFIAILHILCIIYWWNPLFYILKSNAQKMIELCVDNAVANNLNQEEKLEYLQCLLNAAKYRNTKKLKTFCYVGFYEKQTNLTTRFYNILKENDKHKGYLLPYLILILVILSTSIIIEPYAISNNDAKNTFEINTENSYFIEKNNQYELYIDNKYCYTINDVSSFNNIPVYYYSEEIKNEKN